MALPIFKTILLIIIGVIGYAFAYKYYDDFPRIPKLLLFLVSFFVTVMWLFYNLTIFHYLDMLKLIRILSYGMVEYTSFFVGIFSAMAQRWINNRYKIRGEFSRHNGLVFLIILMLPLYLYPIIYPVETRFLDRWKDGVCLQSSPESCGPACVATMLRYYDIIKTEAEIAPRAYLSKMGTDIWHLARYLRRNDLKVTILPIDEYPEDLPVPCLAMVAQENAQGFNHCIVIFNKTKDAYTIGDPQYGLFTWQKSRVFKQYFFLGYIIHVTKE
ncbi:hypothetical protein JW926_13730 [Candidatus Sumerlaeota bacterium]|nr:hypothetical protein [Candidatus Sumerlaeota bacterium]